MTQQQHVALAASHDVMVKSGVLLARMDFVQRRCGREAGSRLLESVSPELRHALTDTKHPEAWRPFALFIEANEAIDKLHGNGDGSLAREMGRHAASAHPGPWVELLRNNGLNPSIIMRLAPGLWSSHYTSGRLVVQPRGDAAVTISILDFARPSHWHCLGVAGWIEGALHIAGAATVEVKDLSCRARGDLSCVMSARWTEGSKV